ncbi:hypothetical protein Gotri_026017 [Gossypium trilobum]|uniref:RNase H type-1 domain-containing protein n=1 Tax=Gossypium trilobum TaxID=34281 RepID=A0A7J9FMA3_9ROSI|nr:hypothetical protein [Gossypium trilobum]
MRPSALLIKSIPLSSFLQEDHLVWGGERSSIFTVRSGYRLLLQGAFGWAVRLPAVSVKTVVAVRLEYCSDTVACHLDVENVNHVFRFCAFAKDVWVALEYTTQLVDESTNQGVGELVVFIRSYRAELAALASGAFQLTPYVTVKWSPPQSEFVKINVDAGFHLAQKKASSGVILRDEIGQILGACSRVTYPVLSVFAAEAIAVIHDLRFAYELGFLSVILEWDSRSVIEKISSDKEDLSEITALTWDAKELSKLFRLSFPIYRTIGEQNSACNG